MLSCPGYAEGISVTSDRGSTARRRGESAPLFSLACGFRLLATRHSPLVSSHFEPSTLNFERFSPLTPLFPLDASHSPVTPLFPLDTRNRGVHPPSNMTRRSILEFLPASEGRALQEKEEPKNRPRKARSATTNSTERHQLGWHPSCTSYRGQPEQARHSGGIALDTLCIF